MTPAKFFAAALHHADRAVSQIKSDQWQSDTPDTEWDVRQLLRHMVYELAWVPDLLAGRTLAQIGDKYEGDILGRDPLASWQDAQQAAITAANMVDLKGTVHLSYANVTAEDNLYECGGDVFIHGWDMARAIGVDDSLDPKLAKIIYDKVRPRAQEFAASGLFGKPIKVASDAPIATKLLAFYGRKA